jgi:ABC-type glycerol-3-phosphate transport system substrate-binding protein
MAPLVIGPQGIAINLELLDRAGLKAPAASWTWQDFMTYAVKMTERSGTTTRIWGASTPTGTQSDPAEFFASGMWAHGGDWVDAAKQKSTFHQAPGIAMLEKWVDLTFRQKVIPEETPAEWQGLTGGAFQNGLAAMTRIEGSSIPGILRSAPANLRWTTVQNPRDKQQGAHFFAFAWFVPKGAKQRDGGAEFVRLAMLPENVATWNIGNFTQVTRKSAASRPEWQNHLKSQPLLQPFSEAMNYTRTYPAVAGWLDAVNEPNGIGHWLRAARVGEVSPRQALENAARFADDTLARNRQ